MDPGARESGARYVRRDAGYRFRKTALGFVLAALLAAGPLFAAGGDDEFVAFNTNSLKYHCSKCEWARKCTRKCMEVKKARARASGGVPCKVCGGSCTADSEDAEKDDEGLEKEL